MFRQAIGIRLSVVAVLLAVSAFVACGGLDDPAAPVQEDGTPAAANAPSIEIPSSAATATAGVTPTAEAGIGYVKPAREFLSVSAGSRHTCGVRPDKTVECWGSNGAGQARPPVGEFLSVSAGGGHTCGVKTDKTVACWGSTRMARPRRPTASSSR